MIDEDEVKLGAAVTNKTRPNAPEEADEVVVYPPGSSIEGNTPIRMDETPNNPTPQVTVVAPEATAESLVMDMSEQIIDSPPVQKTKGVGSRKKRTREKISGSESDTQPTSSGDRPKKRRSKPRKNNTTVDRSNPTPPSPVEKSGDEGDAAAYTMVPDDDDETDFAFMAELMESEGSPWASNVTLKNGVVTTVKAFTAKERMFQYNSTLVTGEQAEWDFEENFSGDFFAHDIGDTNYLAGPSTIGGLITRVFKEDEANATFSPSADAVWIEALKEIPPGQQVNVYSGPSIDYKMIDGEWKHYVKHIDENHYKQHTPLVRIPRPKGVEGCADKRCTKSENCKCLDFGPACDKACDCAPKPDLCRKRPFNTPFSKVIVKESDISGKGLFTTRAYRRYDWVVEYIGEMVVKDERERREEYYDRMGINYLVQTPQSSVDATRMSNGGRYMNHSCDPNTRLLDVIDDKEVPRMVFRAIKAIKEGDELTWDYNEIVDDESELVKCECSEKGCAGYFNRLKSDRDIESIKDIDTATTKLMEEHVEKVAEKKKLRKSVNEKMDEAKTLYNYGKVDNGSSYAEAMIDIIQGYRPRLQNSDDILQLKTNFAPPELPRQAPKPTKDVTKTKPQRRVALKTLVTPKVKKDGRDTPAVSEASKSSGLNNPPDKDVPAAPESTSAPQGGGMETVASTKPPSTELEKEHDEPKPPRRLESTMVSLVPTEKSKAKPKVKKKDGDKPASTKLEKESQDKPNVNKKKKKNEEGKPTSSSRTARARR